MNNNTEFHTDITATRDILAQYLKGEITIENATDAVRELLLTLEYW